MKFQISTSVSLSANETKTVETLTAKAGERITLIGIAFTSSGSSKLRIYLNQTKVVEMISDYAYSIDHIREINIVAEPGDEISIEVEDTSGASNTVKIFYEYERTTA